MRVVRIGSVVGRRRAASVLGRRRICCYAAVALATTGASGALARPAAAVNPLKAGCVVAGTVSPAVRKGCTVLQIGLRGISALKSLFSGHPGDAIDALLGLGGSAAASSATSPAATAALSLAAIATWVLGGATFALHETAKVLSETTAPQLDTTWFSSTYWRVAGIAALLTLPFLFAAAVQALVRSDITLLLRAALGYLPLAMLAVAIAAPVTMLLLAASDQMANAVSAASGNASAHFLHLTGVTIAALTVLTRSPFIVFFIGLLTVAGAVTLWIELLVREAAVYVVVLMLPLFFSAMVWPARRIWALRTVELLVALILSKFAIVAVLSLGGAAISASHGFSVTGMLAGVVLLGMAVFAPWALLRLIPLAELASSAASSLRSDRPAPMAAVGDAWGTADGAQAWATTTTAMRRDSERGLSVGSDTPARMNGSGSNGTGDSHGAQPAAADAAEDPTVDDLPTPEPEEPDLADGSRAGANAAGAASRASAPRAAAAADASGRSRSAADSDLPEMLRHRDRSFTVVLGPEGVGAPPPWSQSGAPGSQSGPLAGQPPGGRDQPGDAARTEADRTGDDHDPTPPPQAPPEGRL